MPAREQPPQAGEADFSNVVPFVRPRASDASRTVPEIVLPADAVRLPDRSGRERMRIAAFVALSLLLHSGLLALLWHEPPPLASIGLEVISVEVVLGATAPAGVATAPGENEMQSAAAPDKQAAEPEQTVEKATEQPQEVAVAEKEAAPEVKPEPKAEEPKPEEPKQFETAAAPPEQVTEKPHETPPDTTEVTVLSQPEEKPVEKTPEPKPVQAAPPKPVKNAVPARDNRRIEAPTRDKPAKEAKASAPSSQANNVGVGRSAVDSNYPGLVSAHLRRYQQYPSDARGRGDQGTATVSFSLDGGGRVTSARLTRSSGIASIDGEVQAMVRRASPFPAPPGGRAQSFSVPVNFRLN